MKKLLLLFILVFVLFSLAPNLNIVRVKTRNRLEANVLVTLTSIDYPDQYVQHLRVNPAKYGEATEQFWTFGPAGEYTYEAKVLNDKGQTDYTCFGIADNELWDTHRAVRIVNIQGVKNTFKFTPDNCKKLSFIDWEKWMSLPELKYVYPTGEYTYDY